MSGWPWLALILMPPAPSHPMDAPIPPRPHGVYDRTGDDEPQTTWRAREIGTGTTVYVNFDGVSLGECNPSNSKKNCHWYNFDRPIEPFSGTLQTQVAILQAMRRDVADFGIRVTGTRPPSDENYTMVVYGGTEQEYGALGSAPAGDCFDAHPDEIAFAHVDGELASWINGGATTALHEAAHTWGLDHIGEQGAIMYPSGDNRPTAFRETCDRIVADVNLAPGTGSCADLNEMLCGDPNLQNAAAVFQLLFGPPYVDAQPPDVELVEPADGQYFQAPASFDVRLAVDDDLHPQRYALWAWLAPDARPDEAFQVLTPGFPVRDLPIGTWTFHVVVADEAGNETELSFDIEVGEDPPPEPDEGCTCGVGVSGRSALGWGVVLVALCRRRR